MLLVGIMLVSLATTVIVLAQLMCLYIIYIYTNVADVPIANSSQKTSVTEDHPTPNSCSEKRHLSLDVHQPVTRQETDQDKAL